MRMVNRGVVVIKPRQPFLDWANSLPDPTPATLESLREDCIAVLVPDMNDERSVDIYMRRLYRDLFEMHLEGWYTDEALWPQKRTYKTFCEWFDVEYHSMVYDGTKRPLIRELEELGT